MAQRYTEIINEIQALIEAQKIFVVGTAASDGRVNVSPKGMDTFKVLGPNRVVWLDVTGSGNETAAHVTEFPRMTIMFATYEGAPLILRLYGTARVVHQQDADWSELVGLFDTFPGVRQIFDVAVDLVQASCGMAVPYYDYVGERELLNQWAERKGPEGIKAYWQEKNLVSLDGKQTGMADRL